MRKSSKRSRTFLTSIFLIITIFLTPSIIYADDFTSIDMSVNIDEKGVADVKETWVINEDNRDYTERYKRIENLRGLKIRDFTLRSNGKDFTQVSPWDIDKSFDQKSYKYGRVDEDDAVELAWGISEFSKNTYELSYKIDPLVIGLNDADMVFFNFVGSNFDPKPESINIKISTPSSMGDNVKMWGFGLIGDIKNVDGDIILKSSGDVDYATIMLKFPKGSFATSYREDKNFNDYANQAVKDSDWQENEGNISKDESSLTPRGFFIGFLSITSFIIAIFGLIIALFLWMVKKCNTTSLYNDKALKKPKELKEEYYRDIPYGSYIENLTYPISKADPYKYNLSNLINALILKWIYEGYIEIKEEKKFFGKESKIKVLKVPETMGKSEKEFFDILDSSVIYSDDGYISNKNIEKYFRKNREEGNEFFDNIEKNAMDGLKNEGYIIEKEIPKKIKLFGKTKKVKEFSDKGISLYENLIKFKNYLEDYSLIEERDVKEVKIWDYYLIYAALFGISEKVFKNLAKTYPDYELNSFYNLNTLSMANSYSSHLTSSVGPGSSFNSAGSGGSTSFSGGGGSFGGGGGGGR